MLQQFPPPHGSRTNTLPSSLKFDKLRVADLQVVSLLKQMHLSIRCLEVKDYRQHEIKIYAISHDPGVGLMKAFSSSNAEKTTKKINQLNWKPVDVISHKLGVRSHVISPVLQQQISFLQACKTLKWTPPELLGHYSPK